MKQYLLKPQSVIGGINVTPIIDVALVLVIILLITAPILSVSDPEVKLPRAKTRGSDESPFLNISLTRDGRIEVEEQEVAIEQLPDVIGAKLVESSVKNPLVVVRADAAVLHRDVSRILDVVNSAGATRIAVATTQIEREDRWTLKF
jgi:biopolymer transport protein TolR